MQRKPHRKSKSSKKRAPKRSAGAKPTFSATWSEAGVWRIPEVGKAGQRQFNLETLTTALAASVEAGNAFFLPAARQLARASKFSRLKGALTVETATALEFRLELFTATRKSAKLRLVVAKNDEEYGREVKQTYRVLEEFAERAPKHLPKPLKWGLVFLPDRHGRTTHHRKIPAYVTAPLPPSSPGVPDKEGQFVVFTPQRKLLSLDDSDAIKRRILECCFKAYDEPRMRALPPPDPFRSELRFRLAKRMRPEVLITGSSQTWSRMDRAKLLHRLTGFDWEVSGVNAPLLPAAPAELRQALDNVFGKEEALKWLRTYLKSLQSGRFTPHHRLPREAVADMAEVSL